MTVGWRLKTRIDPFGAIHYTQLPAVVPLAALGMILGYMYERTGSLGGPILLHMLFNVKTLIWHAQQATAP